MPTRRLYAGLLGLALALVAIIAVAAAPQAVRKQIESSTVITGTIDIEPDGSVSGHVLDQPELLSKSIIALMTQAVPGWRFEPVEIDGKPVKARAKMSVRLVAKKQEKGRYLVSIRSASFGEEEAAAGESVEPIRMRPPSYPMDAVYSMASGVVFVVLRIGRDGRVTDAIAERINLRAVGSEQQMKQARDLLAKASLAAAKKWTFTVPASGPEAVQDSWNVRVPIDFRFFEQRAPKYGEWEAYVPGPYQRAPWVPADADHAQGNDALIAGGVYPIDGGPKLLTPLGGDAG